VPGAFGDIERNDTAALQSRKPATLSEVLDAWDAMNKAAARICTAQPHQMTRAAERLETVRLEMHDLIQRYAQSLIEAPAEEEADSHDPSQKIGL